MSSDTYVGYQINSGGRGTLNLLWSCLATIVLCTWTIQRLQVVRWSESKTIMLRKKTFWMLITLRCPEYVTWIAFEQWQRARNKAFTSTWEVFKMVLERVPYEGESLELKFNTGKDDIEQLNDAVCFTIRLDDLILLVKANLLPLPNIGIQDLNERSKNDHFARVVTSIQVLYFVVQSFGRLGSKLPISTLEISTLAFVCCAAFIEYFWWYKPLDLRTASITTLPPDKHKRFVFLLPSLRFNPPEQDLAEKVDLKLFFKRILDGDEMKRNIIYAVWIGCIFNGIHITAWNSSFPSESEQNLWRIASVGACLAVFSMWTVTFIHPRNLGLALAGLLATFYCICRIYLMVEVFVGLRSVPEALYQTATWQDALPGV